MMCFVLYVTIKVIYSNKYMIKLIKTIETPQQMEYASDTLGKLKLQLKEVVKDKEKVTAPLNEALKAERARYAPIIDAIETSISEITQAITVYNNAQLELQASILENAELDPLQAINTLSTINTNAKVQTSTGSLSFRVDRVLDIINDKIIPRKYLTINTQKILTDLKATPPIKIKGVQLKEIHTPVSRNIHRPTPAQ